MKMMIMMLMTKILIMTRWYVEYQKNNDCVVIGETEPNQSVYLFKCENSTVQVLMMMVEVMMMVVEVLMMVVTNPVSYTHLTLPTILLV